MKDNSPPPDGELLLPVSWGDFLDRLTIQELKADRLPDDNSRAHASRQLVRMQDILAQHAPLPHAVLATLDELRVINASLWETESAIRQTRRALDEREHEASLVEFCNLAQTILSENERRAVLKRAADQAMGHPGESKHY